MPRIIGAKEFSVEELFLGMEAGYRQVAEIAQKDRLIMALGEIVQSGSTAIPYDNPGVFGVEISEGVDVALVDKYRLEKETAAMRGDLHERQRRLLKVFFGATVTVDTEQSEGRYGEKVWGVSRTVLRSRPTLIKERLEGEVEGMVTGLHVQSSTIRLENRHYRAGISRKYIEVPMLDRFGQRCAKIDVRTPGRFERVSQGAIDRAARQLDVDKKALLP